ncbi:response regulator transcription factor [Nocardia nova]|uniref:response regulator transcription factor n=1 Tax=Nocardia nova TaxID=37330 RepID=UPI0018958A4E|nr:response regulator transcription factor [Nocardia nova]MBF6149578.1 response regulator transcription factor [Nocardia nova]
MTVDDEALVRSGFAAILAAAPDLEVVGTSGGGGAVELITAQRPDVVLLDIRMPDGLSNGPGGIDQCPQARSGHDCRCAVVVGRGVVRCERHQCTTDS